MLASLVNGEEGARVSMQDRGLAYGDGVFETVRVANGRPALWRRHLARLEAGCARLGIPPQTAAVERDAARLLDGLKSGQNNNQNDSQNSSQGGSQNNGPNGGDARRAPTACVLKIVVTRGGGARGYRPPAGAKPSRLLWLDDAPRWPAHYATRGVAVRVCQQRLADAPELAGIKHLNRLPQVLARMEWEDDYQEGLMLDRDGRVVEGTMSNVLAFDGERLLAPRVARCGVAGVMRAHLLDGARGLGLRAAEADLTPDALARADGAALCNSLIGLWPIARLGARALPLHAKTAALAELAAAI